MNIETLESTISPGNNENRLIEMAAKLANSKLFKNYMVYEKAGECWFGGGVVRSVTLFADRIETRNGDQLSSRKVAGEQLCQALAEELSTWSGAWQASGWACFELAYALKAPHLLSDAEARGEVPLLYLCQPIVAVSLSNGSVDVHTQAHSLGDQVRDLLDNIAPLSPVINVGVSITGCSSYEQAVADALTNINNGLLEKVILSRRQILDFSPDFVATWLLGRQQNTPSRSFTLDLGGWRVSGFSPEIVLAVDNQRQLTTEPLAGTRRLDGVAEEDFSRFNELYRDPKETHEHAISVRLSVNEMNSVCEPASIAVHQFMERKLRGSVQHLASTVCGKLREDRNAWHAFTSLFPAVTASGIPKREAFTEIRRHEKASRGLYAGAILRVDHDGTLDAALVLRSLLGDGQQAWLQAGAGVVSASHPERELTETSEKLGSVAPWVVRQ